MPFTNLSNVNDDPARTCPRCHGHDLVDCETTTAIWNEETPYVIERIPALRCPDCSEILIADATAEVLREIARNLADARFARRKIEVPVIAFPAPSLPGPRVSAGPVP